MFKSWLCILLGVVYSTTVQAMVLPKDFQRIMANVRSFDSFMKAMNLGNITLGPPRTLSFTGGRPAKYMNVLLGRSRVVSFSEKSDAPMILDNALCTPYPTVVEVPQPDHDKGIHYPFNVILHRCAGSCNSKPRVHQCVPKATHNITLLTFVVAWSSTSDKVNDWHRAPRLIQMVNHTKCGCQCITKPSECNPATQKFVEDSCRCECTTKSRLCPSYHVWDPIHCKCICNPPQNIYCPRRFEWSANKCACVCKKVPCRAKKFRNQRNCRCYCSKKLPRCGDGFRRRRRDCKCIRY